MRLKHLLKRLKSLLKKKAKKELSEREKTVELYGIDLVETVERAEKSMKEGNVVIMDNSKSLEENIKIWENTI